jgi:2-phospho-L-lactate/phosphoenolpyruvate guanylyltransferase
MSSTHESGTTQPTHVVLLPVKPPARGKSRLRGIPDDVRRQLAEAFALDTATACLNTPGVGAVLAVTDDAAFATDLAAVGCFAIPDGITDDLNGSLRLAAAEAARRWPTLRPAALLGDLPALRPADLTVALASAPPTLAAYVADADGLGTTLYTAPIGLFDPQFGGGSQQRHQNAGALSITGPLASLRRDVDDLDALGKARELGVGRFTAAVVARLL